MRRLLSAAVAGLVLAPAAAEAGESHSKLRRELNSVMGQTGAGSGAYVWDLTDGRALYSRMPTKRRILASNVKLFTTAAALDRFGSQHSFETSVLADRRPDGGGRVRGNLYLRGGGDPAFGSRSFAERAWGRGGATLEALAQAVRRAGVRRVTGRVLGDESLFDSLRGGPGSGYGVSVWVGPLSALSYNRGLARERGSAFQSDPPSFAAKRLERALERAGVEVRRPARAGRAGPRAVPIAAVPSLPLARLMQITNRASDNYFAETLAKHLEAARASQGTTAGGSASAAAYARRRHGARVRLVDGSGLARANLGAPRAVVRLLRGMRRHPEFRAFYDSLALPGRYGTLSERMRRGPARSRCRGKTGTIRSVSNLSGYCRSKSGDLIAFSFLMNRVGSSYEWARGLQDRMAQALARHG